MEKSDFDKVVFEDKKRREIRKMEFWNNLPTFINITDVPPLPVGISQDEWKSFYVSKLIKAGAIPKSNLIDQEYYLGDHRRAVIAQWDSKLNKFKYNSSFHQSIVALSGSGVGSIF